MIGKEAVYEFGLMDEKTDYRNLLEILLNQLASTENIEIHVTKYLNFWSGEEWLNGDLDQNTYIIHDFCLFGIEVLKDGPVETLLANLYVKQELHWLTQMLREHHFRFFYSEYSPEIEDGTPDFMLADDDDPDAEIPFDIPWANDGPFGE